MLSLFLYLSRSFWNRNIDCLEQQHQSKSSEQESAVACMQYDLKTDKEKWITGVVTKLNNHECYGIINQFIYFSFDAVCGNEEVNVGTQVFVHASRLNVNHGWKAISVRVCKCDWECNQTGNSVSQQPMFDCKDSSVDVSSGVKEEFVETIEGEVTDCYGLFGFIDNKYQFEVEDCEIDFRPVVGDFIIASVLNQKVISWYPKLILKVEGIVTAHDIDCGIVNENIIFFFSSCQYDAPVVCGEKVLVDVVESNQQLFKKRAFSLRLTNSQTVDQYPKPCFHDQTGLHITSNFDFDYVEVGQEKSMSVTIRNDMKSTLSFICCQLRAGKNSPFSVCNSSMQTIPSHSELMLEISCKANSVGRHDALLLFEFEEFCIARKANVVVVDPIQSILKPTLPYNKQKRTKSNQRDGLVIIPGEKLHFPKANFAGHKPQYAVPRNLWKVVEEQADISQALPGLLKILEANNYVRKFSCLLHLEEIQMNIHMRNFDMHEVVLKRRGEFLCLEIPGLAEGRPSLLIGDKAMLLPPNVTTFMYEGYIHEVHKDDIFLKFNEKFQNSYGGETYDVTFRFSRSSIKRLHESISIVFRNNVTLLFPKYLRLQKPLVKIFPESSSYVAKMSNIRIIDWQNKSLNLQQKEAVQRILEGRCRPLPYVIFGPPGTGKTATVVEAVLQIYLMFKNARILICTPSNSAADLIAQWLVESKIIGKTQMVRINSYQRNVDSIPEFIKPFCQDKETIENVVNFPIVISTCTTSGAFHRLELAYDHFTHLFIDEAGQLTEPESMIPISLIVYNRNANLILAGDPQQLGPVLLSEISQTYGLQTSYLERIMQCNIYTNKSREDYSHSGFNPYLVTMLIHCYRSHFAILYYSSQAFYFSQVQCNVKAQCDSILENWELLPKKGFPVVFHGVRGAEHREENSPSWFNSAEVVQVCQYLRSLYKLGLTSSEIGIIAPYKKQVEKIRLLATAFSLELCKVGSVEEFQGQERRAIIISTVRSCEDFINYDILHNLGFLSNSKRFNVAVTRAKELLIVVGNPYVLSQDSVWNGFIKYCRFNGGYTGCDISAVSLE